jgi:hypothetical protein
MVLGLSMKGRVILPQGCSTAGVLAGELSCCRAVVMVVDTFSVVAVVMGVYHWCSCSAELGSMLGVKQLLSLEEGKFATSAIPVVPPELVFV